MKAIYDAPTNTLTKADGTKINCDPSCRDKFVHGGEYEEGKDYKVVLHYHAPDEKELLAFPLSTPVQEDIQDMKFTFHETLDLIADFGRHVLSAKNEKWDMANDAAEWLSDQIKTKNP